MEYDHDHDHDHDHEADHDHDHDHEHEHEGEIDEHVWTSPVNAIAIVNKIAQIVETKDPDNAEFFEANRKAYVEKLTDLDRQFRDVVSSSKRKTILFGDRFPFRYFADEYGLEYYAAFPGCSAQVEASAATVAFLTDKVKEDKLPVVFTIELSNGKIADAIGEATGAQSLTLNSCHNVTKDQMDSGETYLSLMQKNVETLRIALN
jgi:zinc transport system substrate-binding protein